MFQNINGFGYNKDNSRAEELRQLMNQYEVDAMMMAEMNVNWRLVQKKHSIYDTTRGWFENQAISIGYNQRHRCKSPHLPGGVGIICQGEAALRRIKTKADTSRMGRWTWTLIAGKNNIKLRFVSVYVPCISNDYGNKKVYCQQQKALQQMGKKGNPLTVFWNDFWTQIDEWLQQGDQLVVGGDWNTDVRKDDFLLPFRERNLIPAITTSHGLQGPETYNRGTKPIDEIFVSSTIDIQSCGYLPHGYGLGDHRPIWVEITKDSALGAKLPDVPYYSGRRLKLRDPRTVARYLRHLEEFCNKHNLFERVEKLFASVTPLQPLTLRQSKEYEKLDKLRVKAMLSAEKNCRKLYMGGVRWSPKIQLARDRIKYLRNSISHRKGTKINTRTLCRDSKRAQMDVTSLSLAEIEKKLGEAFDSYKELKKEHVKIRQSYLEELAQAMEDQGKGKKATHLRNLIRIEEQREIFRKLKRVTGKDNNLGTTFVKVTDDNGNMRDIIEKEEIEQAIMDENCKKYHQTEDTCPFIKNPILQEQFGFYGEGPASQMVFNGTYTPPPGTDRYTTAYLERCQASDEIEPAKFDRTWESYKKSWEVIDERISSRLLHYGHFKAACRQKELINLHFQMSEIPFQTGYGPTRWREATQVMILKKAGVHNIDKLRTIVLYEADFNHNNKYFGRQLMQHTKQHQQMAKEQYSVPGKKSIDHALNRRLIFDITRYQKTSIAMTSCDLKSCYDRIAHTPAFLAIVGYRYLPTPIFSMFTCIQNMQWRTRTVYGDSESTFGGWDHRYEYKPQGMGQGNGAGPPVWSTVSSRMFEVLHDMNLSTTFVSPLTSNDIVDICGFAFVDDSDIIAGLRNSNDPDSTVRKMQKTIDCWEGVAKTTGGALEPSKSWWYLIHFEWKDGKWNYGDLSNVLDDNLTALDKNNNRVDLQYLPPDKAQTMLGVELAPDGNNKEQVKQLKAKTSKYADMVRKGHLTYSEAWIALTAMAMKSIEYGLPASTLTEQQLIQIMDPLLQSFLPRCGIQRNVKRDLLYGPISLQGFGLHNPYLTQGISQVVDIIDNCWKDTITGKFIRQCLEHVRIELGCNNNILTSDFEEYSDIILTESWIASAWKFMSKHNITWDDRTSKFPLLRKNDVILMEAIMANHEIPTHELKKINQCRIYLRVVSLADITTGDGQNICSWAMKGKRNLSQSRSDYNWPLWGQPSKTEWRAWRRAIRRTFCIRRDNSLDLPLEEWTVQVSRSWQWFVNCFSDHLFQRLGNEWTVYKLLGRRTRHNRYRKIPVLGEAIPPLETMSPTTIQEYANWYQCQGTRAVSERNEFIPPLNQTSHLAWLSYTHEISNSKEQLICDIKNGDAIAVSDGSYDPCTYAGAAAWTIESNNGQEWVKGTSISPGHSHIQSPYRSEILGILGILQFLSTFCTEHDIRQGSIRLACDGISALRQSTRKDIEKVSCRIKQSDLLSACTKLLASLPISIRPEHVKGHQDDVLEYSSLPRPARMNVDMDYLAKATLEHYQQSTDFNFLQSTPHPLSFVQPKVNGVPIMQDTKNSLMELISGELLHDYWIQKGRYSRSDIQHINWNALTIAMTKSNLNRRRFISKWISENIGTGKNMKRWKKRPHDYCPYCKHPAEDTTHILRCTNEDATINWHKHLLDYLMSLYKLGLSTSILIPLKYELMKFKNPTEIDSTAAPSCSASVSKVLDSQKLLGWRQFLEGLYSNDWKQYIDTIKAPQASTDQILSKMIKKGWDFLFSVWEERNQRLHHTDHILDLEGRKELLETINKEWRLGLSMLPASDYGYFFTKPIAYILNQSIDWQKDWLATVKQGRELYRDHRRLHDDFSTPGPLRDWIGMTKTPLDQQS